jgi:tetratricopeptide (TPR) repeat protein
MKAAVAMTQHDETGARLERLRGFREADPGNPRLLAEIFDLSLGIGRRDEAHAALAEARARFPDDPHFRFREATLAIAERRLDVAEAALLALRSGNAEDFAIGYNLAYVRVLQERFAEAADLLRELAAAPDAPSEAFALRVHALHHAGDLEGAKAAAREGLAQHGTDPGLLAVASLALWDMGDIDDAGRLADQALARSPNVVAALVTRGSIALGRRDAERAREDFTRALVVNEKDGRSWSGLGLASLLAQDFVAARVQLESAVRHMPGHIGTWHALGWCHIAGQRLAEARGCFERALALDRNFAESHGGLAVVAAMAGNRDAAAESVERALRLDPHCLSARYAQSLLSGEIRDSESFQRMAERLLSGQGDLVKVLARLQRGK